MNTLKAFKNLTTRKNIEVSCETFTNAVPDCMRPYHKDSTVIEFEYSGASIKHFINEPIQGFTIGQFCGSKYVTQYFLIDINE